MQSYEVVPLRAFADNYIWTLRDATHAAVVDPGENISTRPPEPIAREKRVLAADRTKTAGGA